MAGLDMQDEDDALLGEVDVDELIAQHRQKHTQTTMQNNFTPVSTPQAAGNSHIPPRDSGRPQCAHGMPFASCPHR